MYDMDCFGCSGKLLRKLFLVNWQYSVKLTGSIWLQGNIPPQIDKGNENQLMSDLYKFGTEDDYLDRNSMQRLKLEPGHNSQRNIYKKVVQGIFLKYLVGGISGSPVWEQDGSAVDGTAVAWVHTYNNISGCGIKLVGWMHRSWSVLKPNFKHDVPPLFDLG